MCSANSRLIEVDFRAAKILAFRTVSALMLIVTFCFELATVNSSREMRATRIIRDLRASL